MHQEQQGLTTREAILKYVKESSLLEDVPVHFYRFQKVKYIWLIDQLYKFKQHIVLKPHGCFYWGRNIKGSVRRDLRRKGCQHFQS